MSSEPALHIVLVEPEIPQNVGNIGRTCLALGARLHLVGQLGFSLDERQLKRAGLDYWKSVDVVVHAKWEPFIANVPPGAQMLFFSSRGRDRYWETALSSPLYLVFGSESRGLPPAFYRRHDDALVRLPMADSVRSLNLATAAGIAAYDAARRLNLFSKIPA